MTTTTRPNGFPALTMPGSSNKTTQPQNPYGTQPWSSNGIHNIWSIGGSLSTHREAASSRGSDELSPTAPSGSAQLNPSSEPAPWASRAIWSQSNSSPSNASPTLTRDPYINGYENGNAPLYPPRQSISQGTSGGSNRTVPPGPPDNSRYTSAVGSRVNDETKAPAAFSALANTSTFGMESSGSYRRNSADPSFLGLGQSRTAPFKSRQSEIEPVRGTRLGDIPTHPFGNAAAHAQFQAQRPSISGPSISQSNEAANRSQTFALQRDANHTDLSEPFARGLNIDDASEPLGARFPNSGYLNPASQPFQFNPGSQSWQHDSTNGGRPSNQGHQLDSWANVPHQYSGHKRASVDRSSQVGMSYRPNVNSPKSSFPNSRGDPWNRAAPRHQSLSLESDRQSNGSHYMHQPNGYYPNSYFNSPALQPNPIQFTPAYDQYSSTPGFRLPMTPTGYPMPMNYMTGQNRAGRGSDLSTGMRSTLLEEYRNNKQNFRPELKQIYGHINEFCGDQHGSRLIQEKLHTANSDEKDQVFREIEPNILQLTKDLFGNYVIQKFFEHGNQVQKKIMALTMKGMIPELSIQMYSCRVVQKALEHVLVEQQAEIVEELKPHIIRISKDTNGNHVIQKIVELVPRLCVPFIMETIRGEVYAWATHSFACRIIQRLMERGDEGEVQSLMNDLHAHAPRLVTDQYGNYVIQHIIEKGKPEDRAKIIRYVTQKLVPLSKHKYASNVVEKCIKFGTVEDKRTFRAILTTNPDEGPTILQMMLKDQFGNYVIQKLIECLNGTDKDAFMASVEPDYALIKKQGARQITALDKLIAEYHNAPLPSATPAAGITGTSSITATASPTPNLMIEVSSGAPTPPLTTEQNSPQSISPPSTNVGSTDEAGEESKGTQDTELSATSCPITVQDQ
ncbi:ARM repeat-containing protein [Xylariaceae sp. FL1272]|nr:ARM repeat-containing protein [Xylariaceae sp. FL1272]